MRKVVYLLFTFFMLSILSGCGNTVIGHDGLIGKAREEISVSDAETIGIMIAGSVDIDRKSLVWFVTGNEYQSHSYIPMEFEIDKNQNDKFKFIKVYKAMDRAEDIAVIEWEKGYSFLVNNDKCKTISIINNTGKKEEIEVDGALPWLYYCETIPVEYVFLDSDGNELN